MTRVWLRHLGPVVIALVGVTLFSGCLALYGRVRIPAYEAGTIPAGIAATLRCGEYGGSDPGVQILSINGTSISELVNEAERYQGYRFHPLACREYALMPGKNDVTVRFLYKVKVITGSDGTRIYYRKEDRYSKEAAIRFEAAPGRLYVIEGDRKAFTVARKDPFTFTLYEMKDDGGKRELATVAADLKKESS